MDKKEVKKEEQISKLEWLKVRYDGIMNDKLDSDLCDCFSDMMTHTVHGWINDHGEFITDMEQIGILELHVYTAPASDNYRKERYPHFRKLSILTTEWTSRYLGLIAPMEMRDFMLFLCENAHNFNWLCNFYRNAMRCELFKLNILNDYLTDNLSAEEEELFKICEKVYLDNGVIFPYGYERTPEFKVTVFMNMFFYDEEEFESRSFLASDFLDKDWYGDFIYNRMKNIENGEAMWYFYSNTYNMIEHNIRTVYGMFYKVNKETIPVLEKKVKDYHLEHSKKISFLVELCHMIIDYWDKLKEETAKKFKLDNIRKVDISIVNTDFLENFLVENYSDHNQGSTFEEFVDKNDVYLGSSAITHFGMDSYGNTKLEVFVSLSRKIREILTEWKNLSKDEIFNNIQITLRHEMGHVVYDCMTLDKNGLDIALYSIAVNAKKTIKIKKRYWNTPEEERLPHTYWYYTCLPMERKANELMGLTVEEMYKANNEPIPDEVKKLIEEVK